MAVAEISFEGWPESNLPGRAVYVAHPLRDEEINLLEEKGWSVTDVRALPCSNMIERQGVVLAWLEGVRQGTIIPGPKMLDFLELEAQITGLKTGKQQMEEKKLSTETLESILSFKSHRARDGSVAKTPQKK